MRTFIISQPKAGTYLCANLLVELGLKHTGMHCKGTGKYQAYDLDDPDAIHKGPEYTKEKGNFMQVLDLIPDNAFAVGHLEYTDKHIDALKNFKKVLVTRPFKDFDAALERFQKEMNRKVAINKNKYEKIKKWNDEQDVFMINFYDMIDKNEKKIDELQMHLFGEVRVNSLTAITNALEAKSLTKTSLRES